MNYEEYNSNINSFSLKRGLSVVFMIGGMLLGFFGSSNDLASFFYIGIALMCVGCYLGYTGNYHRAKFYFEREEGNRVYHTEAKYK